MAIAQALLPYHVELVDSPELVTSHAALPLVLELMRAVIASSRYRDLRDALGYTDWKTVQGHVESVVLLVVAGGEHTSDLDVLRADRGLEKLLGRRVSCPTQIKDFLYRFHQHKGGGLVTPKEDAELSVAGKARIREEGPGLVALERLVLDVVEALVVTRPRDTVTLDVDATILTAHKKTALVAYEGTRGYQPQMAWWAEQGVWVCDQFRDGNVPAAFQVRGFLERAFAAVPAGLQRRRLRADSALYDEDALTWVDDQGIDFVVSADMTEALRAKVERIPEQEWKPYKSLSERAAVNEERQWAEVIDFIPGWKRNHRKTGEALRYIAVRVRTRQKELFEGDASAWRHFAVCTNMDWQGDRLLRWHREKQGTVEHAHGVLKNDLGGGCLPTGKFGSNAAWWRLNVLAHNLLELLKTSALPESLASARPKTLRFQLLTLPGRLVHHARAWILKISAVFPLASAFVAARERLAQLAQRLGLAPA